MIPASWQTVFAVLATLLTLVVFVPYVRGLRSGRVRPHVFSWVIWGINTSVAFFATHAARGGAGAWVIGFSALVTLGIAVLAWRRRADVTITRADWAFFAAALAALPLWWGLDDPLAAVVLVTLIELLGFGPTFRKTWHAPESESLSFMLLLVMRNALVIAALQTWSATTLLFPLAMAAACAALAGMMLWRRRAVRVGGAG